MLVYWIKWTSYWRWQKRWLKDSWETFANEAWGWTNSLINMDKRKTAYTMSQGRYELAPGHTRYAPWLYLRPLLYEVQCGGDITRPILWRNIHQRLAQNSSPVRARHGVSFVGHVIDWFSTTVLAIMYTISCYTGPRYNGNRLYLV